MEMASNKFLCFALFFIMINMFEAQNIFSINGTEVSADPEEDAFIRLTEYVKNLPKIKYKMPPSTGKEKTVHFGMYPYQILDVDDVRQTVILISLLTMHWTLPTTSWNASEFGNLHMLTMDSSLIWTPRIVMPRNTDDHIIKLVEKFSLSSAGIISTRKPLRTSMFCYLDHSWFPFDEHNCTIAFLEQTGFKLEVIETEEMDTNYLQYFAASAEWDLLQKGCSIVTKPGVADFTECWFTMKRHSLFYVLCIVCPPLIISGISLAVFWIPPESGEKMSFIVTLCVSLTVFLTILIETIPRSIVTPPRIILLNMLTVGKICGVTVATTFVLRRYQEEVEKENGNQKSTAFIDMHGTQTLPENDGLSYWEGERQHDIKSASPNVFEAFVAERDLDDSVVRKANKRGQSKVTEIRRDTGPCRKLGLRHQQLDKIFFFSFSVSSALAYILLFTV